MNSATAYGKVHAKVQEKSRIREDLLCLFSRLAGGSYCIKSPRGIQHNRILVEYTYKVLTALHAIRRLSATCSDGEDHIKATRIWVTERLVAAKLNLMLSSSAAASTANRNA